MLSFSLAASMRLSFRFLGSHRETHISSPGMQSKERSGRPGVGWQAEIGMRRWEVMQKAWEEEVDVRPSICSHGRKRHTKRAHHLSLHSLTDCLFSPSL